MIKAVWSRPAGLPKLVLLGLSEENVRLLRDGKPIVVVGAELGIDADICVCHGETEQSLRAELRANGLLPPG